MNPWTLRPLVAIIALNAVFAAATAAPAPAGPLDLRATFSKPLMLAGKTDLNYLKVGFTGVPPAFTDASHGRRPRAPLNLALVIDRSGSMAGDKLENARRAALLLVERLGADDIIAVVTYDDEARVIVPATRASDRGDISEAIRRIEVGGSTALFAGVSLGARETLKFLDRRRVNRIILLSDGQANVGPQSPDELGELGASLIKDGISVTTFGLGLGYNEDLMSRLARRSDGNHAFIENANDLARVFDAEFGDAASVVARDVRVTIACRGIRPVRALGRDAEIRGDQVDATLNQVLAGQEKYLLIEVEAPAAERGRANVGATVTVSYTNLANDARESLVATATIGFTDRPGDVSAAENRDAAVAAVNLLANENFRLAARLRDEGKVEQARATLIQNKDYLFSNATRLKAPELEKFGKENESSSDLLDESSWNRTRKQMRQIDHVNATQQSY